MGKRKDDAVLLLPCPFCGGAAEICYVNDDGTCRVECRGDDCTMDECFSDRLPRDKAIAAWNTRAAMSANEVLPPGRTKQDVVNLVDLALSDALLSLGPDEGSRYDYDIFVEKLRGNGLCIVALSCSESTP